MPFFNGPINRVSIEQFDAMTRDLWNIDGGDIRLLRFSELAQRLEAALPGGRFDEPDVRTAVTLLANHGLVAAAPDLSKALAIAEEVEFVARVFCQAKAIGDPVALDAGEMARVIEKFKTYGRQDSGPGRGGG